MKTVLIIDIDITIANTDERAKLLELECLVCLAKIEPNAHRPPCPNCGARDPKVKQSSWDAFLDPKLMRNDPPVPKAQEAIRRMKELGMEFHFITGRNEKLRKVTEEWLHEHFDWDSSSSSLYMRSEEEKNVAASTYKEGALRKLIQERGLQDSAFLFFEDDPYVFRMYQNYGIVISCPEAWDHWMPTTMEGSEPVWRK
jgi:hypothetical protein